ncbi:MAG: YibE/F family protein [Coprobacillaceae bacterium]
MEKLKENKLVIIIIAITMLVAMLFKTYLMKEYNRLNVDTTDYVEAVVKEISSENIEFDKKLDINLGQQVIEVEIKEGEQEGELITINNYLTAAHNVEVKVGTKIIVNADTPKNIEPYYTVYNYNRTMGIFGCIGILMLTMIIIGKGKGIRAIMGLVYSLYIIVSLLLPAVFSGYSPILMSIIIAILSTVVTLLLLNGESLKTYGAILSTVVGVLVSLLFFYIVSQVLHINGFSVSEVESLVLIGHETGLQIKDVLFAGMLISSLGAIMDVGMSIVSALYEVYYHQPRITTKQLFQSGIEIGKDMIGTMSNTLILAFTGGAFVSLLAFLSYGLEFNQLLNSNYLTIEIAQGVCGTLGVVLTVPVASIIAAILLTKKKTLDV